MVFLNVVLLALVLGKFLGGRLGRLAETPIAGKQLVFAAIGLQMIAFPWNFLPWTTPSGPARALWIVSFALLISMLVMNRALPGVAIVAAGLTCNIVAVLANNGLMPVRPSALLEAGTQYHVHNNSIQVVDPNLGLLIDRWAAPQWLPMGNVFSVGDVLIAIGIVVAIVSAMQVPRSARTWLPHVGRWEHAHPRPDAEG